MFQGMTSQPGIGDCAILVVDVGAGSTEWVFGNGGFTHFRHSTRLGTSRLLELCPPGDPPTRADLARWRHLVTGFLRREVCPGLLPALAAFRHEPVCLVGLGGSLKSLALLASKRRAEDEPPALLRREDLREQVERLWRLSSLQRRNLSRLNPEKAEVILAGAVIYEAIMSQFEFTETIRSDQGVRSGMLLSLPAKVVRTNASSWQPVLVNGCLEWGCNEPQSQLPTFIQFEQANASRCQHAIRKS
jgi:exopolyphosphatase/guanosine-5'-triphosphate,3'-diphosphate pyrophosphatase